MTKDSHNFTDSPGVPASANAHELFRGFSFVAPCLLTEEDDNRNKSSSECRNYDGSIHTVTFPSYVNPISISEEYEFKHEIGKGSYSVVYLAVHLASKIEYAIKVMAKKKLR